MSRRFWCFVWRHPKKFSETAPSGVGRAELSESYFAEAPIEALDKALAAALAAQEKKGQNLTLIDVRDDCSYADFLLVVSAYSDRQTAAIADHVVDQLRNQHRRRPLVREGTGPWILIDYGDVVVHIFHEDARAYYELEKLWARSPRVAVPAPQSLISPTTTN